MSAFMVDDIHITELVRAALRANRSGITIYHENESHPVDCTNAEEWAQLLKDENRRSINARYPDTIEDPEHMPGKIGETAEPWVGDIGIVHSILGTPLLKDGHPLPPVAILKAINCYEYQACEHDGWKSSLAQAFCQTLTAYTINSLPGYDEAPWGISA